MTTRTHTRQLPRFMEEEEAFWMLQTALHDVLPPNYYTAVSPATQLDPTTTPP